MGMGHMKKVIAAAVLFSTLGYSAIALSADDAVIQQRVEEVKAEFNLNEQQSQRISAILRNAGMDKDARMAEHMQKRMEHRLNRMKEKLGLTDDQISTIKTIMTEQQAGMKALREQGKEAINAVLTPEQVAKMEEMHSKRGEMHHQRGGHGGHKMWSGNRSGKMCDKH